jgi:hypothetical protein
MLKTNSKNSNNTFPLGIPGKPASVFIRGNEAFQWSGNFQELLETDIIIEMPINYLIDWCKTNSIYYIDLLPLLLEK